MRRPKAFHGFDLMSVAHLNLEIVILDEVLAVGDTVFQKKCFDRMEEIIKRPRGDSGHP